MIAVAKYLGSLIDGWISESMRNHTESKQSNPEGWRPTRLIRVDTISKPPILKIIQTRNDTFEKSDPYMTLSHYWGHPRPTALTQRNEAQMIAGFDLNVSQKTFRDAVYLTRRLGVRYI
ncbi:hypothetical protein K469DRAFT_183353 [Zopfia rhizophila CBS 207.26]|uniref:Heterokaryon incompatibility domain-containing protein n=1 Tax=Zopfia rhizophila CBS 207.26 TaxID=1314779 RepID=A0A6A6DXI3_9PEZI|nr:hypothetical protein K469DRAFT_183353 [Zopfia rhizophila CBS 207.26]